MTHIAAILDSAAGTVIGGLALLAIWMACDWWFDAKAVDRDYPDDPSEAV